MGFRRSDDNSPENSRWRLAHRALLSACGIPSEVVGSDRRWLYVLLHGDDYLGSGWDVSWVSPQQARELLGVLERDLPSEVGYHLVKLLRERTNPAG